MLKNFSTLTGVSLPLPLFFPDATAGFVRELSWRDVKTTYLPGVLVNTFHLLKNYGYEKTRHAGGVRPLIGWDGAIISDSGGFQVMSLAKNGSGSINDEGVTFVIDGVSHVLTPEESIHYQLSMRTDLCVVLDDFTPPDATYAEAHLTVERTTAWAKRCKDTFTKLAPSPQPYLIGVVQGGRYPDLRKKSLADLMAIGFDGFGYGGFPLKENKEFDFDTADLIAKLAPPDSLLYGLGIGKPSDIVGCYRYGWQIFDCVLPTRDARHGRLYIYKHYDLSQSDFYSTYNPRHASHLTEHIPVSNFCDCELCTTVSRAELATMWRAKDRRVLRLATIHNLRFYSILMEKLHHYHLKWANALLASAIRCTSSRFLIAAPVLL